MGSVGLGGSTVVGTVGCSTAVLRRETSGTSAPFVVTAAEGEPPSLPFVLLHDTRATTSTSPADRTAERYRPIEAQDHSVVALREQHRVGLFSSRSIGTSNARVALGHRGNLTAVRGHTVVTDS